MAKSDVKKMVYPEAEQMIKILGEACNQLQDTISEMEGIANSLEGGGLLGQAGDAMAAGVRKQLIGSINRIIEGLEDGSRYIAMEQADMRAAEEKSAKLF
jgi:uncharacterized protein YukE